MDQRYFSDPVDLKKIRVTDEFWHREQELVRREVIPYQWEALNDRVPGAAPSYCMHNFRAAGRLMRQKREKGKDFVPPEYTFRGFEVLPEDPAAPDPDKFYGFVFQDTDFSKWIEAVGYSLTQHPDPELERTADEAIEIVCAAQLENGYLDTYYIINGMDRAFTNLKDHHELYCLGHLVEGAVAYFQATGKDKLLKAACRFADYVAECFGPEEEKCKGYPGHEIAEMALVRLYQVTGEEKYLNLSKFFLDQRGTQPYYFEEEEKKRAALEGRTWKPDASPNKYAYYQAHEPVRRQSEAVGHAVRAGYLYSGMADVARLAGDEELYGACERLWKSIVEEKLYITGGVGATHMGEAFSYPYDLPNDTAYSETCAAIALAFFARRMLQIKPKGQYGDVMELALYNTVLAGMALDGKSFFYVNPLEVTPEACEKDSRKFHVKPVRQKWFGCACCPPNIARIVSSVASYAYTENEDTLWIHLYMGSVLTKEFTTQRNTAGKPAGKPVVCGGKKMDLRLETRMPWEGSAVMRIHAEEPVTGTLAFRLPGWSGNARITAVCGGAKREFAWSRERGLEQEGRREFAQDAGRGFALDGKREPEEAADFGKALADPEVRDGYLYFTGEWQDGDYIALDFDMKVRIWAANPKVREDVGKVALTRGPVTFCMEEADNGKDLHLNRVDLERIGENCQGIVTERTEIQGHPMICLKVPGRRQIWDGDKVPGCPAKGATISGNSGEQALVPGCPGEGATISGNSGEQALVPGCPAEGAMASGQCGEGADVTSVSPLYRKFTPAREEEVLLTFLPYYAWANRGEGEMSVWVRYSL